MLSNNRTRYRWKSHRSLSILNNIPSLFIFSTSSLSLTKNTVNSFLLTSKYYSTNRNRCIRNLPYKSFPIPISILPRSSIPLSILSYHSIPTYPTSVLLTNTPSSKFFSTTKLGTTDTVWHNTTISNNQPELTLEDWKTYEQQVHTLLSISSPTPLSLSSEQHQQYLASLIIIYENFFYTIINNHSTTSLISDTKDTTISTSKYRYTSKYTNPITSPPTILQSSSVLSSSSPTSISIDDVLSLGIRLWIYCSENHYFTQAHSLWSLFRQYPVSHSFITVEAFEKYILNLFIFSLTNPNQSSIILIQIEKFILLNILPLSSLLLQIALYCCSKEYNLNFASELWSTNINLSSSSSL